MTDNPIDQPGPDQGASAGAPAETGGWGSGPTPSSAPPAGSGGLSGPGARTEMPAAAPQPAAQAAPAGWYDTDQGQRYWDGEAWTEHFAPGAGPGGGDAAPFSPGSAPVATASTSDERTMSLLAHLLTFVAGFIAPLVFYLIKKDESTYIRHHAAEALNFQLTLLIGYIMAFVLMFVLIGFLLFPVLWLVSIVFTIIAAVAANRGEWYRYPMTIRFVS